MKIAHIIKENGALLIFSMMTLSVVVCILSVIAHKLYQSLPVETATLQSPSTSSNESATDNVSGVKSSTKNPSQGQVAGAAQSKSEGTASTTGTSINSNQLNLLNYGGVGDGKTDNVPAFTKTLAEASKFAVAEVYVPAGKYYLSDGIVIDHPNITLRMDSGAELFTTKPTSTGGTIGFLGFYKKVANESSTPRQQNAKIIGGTVWNSGNGTRDNAIGFARYDNVLVDGVTVSRCGRKGITPQYGFGKIYIKNVRISNCTYSGISLETDIAFAQISNVQISNISGDAVGGGNGIESISQDVNKPVYQVLIGSTSITNTGRSGVALRNNIKNQIESVRITDSSMLSRGGYAAIYAANTDANRNIETKLRDVTTSGSMYGWAVANWYGTLYQRDPVNLQRGIYGVYTSNTPVPKRW